MLSFWRLNNLFYLKVLIIFIATATAFFLIIKVNRADNIFYYKTLMENTVSSKGYLYKVNIESRFVYVTSDTKVPETPNMKFINTSYIWNPRVCAQMPILIREDGSIYMLETTYNGNSFVKNLIRYSSSDNLLHAIEVDQNIEGKLYESANGVGFFSEDESSMYFNSLKDDKKSVRILTSKIFTKDSDTIYYVKSMQANNVYFVRKKDSIENGYFSFNLLNSKLEQIDSVPRNAKKSLAGKNKITSLKNGVKMLQDIDTNEPVSLEGMGGKNVDLRKLFKDEYIYVLGAI